VARIVKLWAVGGPEVLVLEDAPTPQPRAGEVRIKVGAIGLNRIEAIFRAGGFGAPAFPALIGYEAAGRVDALGEGVSDFAVGDAVAILPGIEMGKYGAYGETMLCPADMLVRSVASQSMEEAAASWMQYLTAYAIVETGGMREGDAVIVTAASSSVGLAAIQIVRAEGGVPIAVTRGPEKAERLRALGAAHVVVSRQQDLAEAVMQATGGKGAAIAFDAVAGDALGTLAPALAPGGIIILYGSLGGDTASFNAPLFMLHGCRLHGFAANRIVMDPQKRRAAVNYVRAGLECGVLKPVIDRVFALEEIAAAHRYLESNAQLGKIVVRAP
jgi:NADPH:quinone reductase-like Zn-dependent oxidoreductase